MRVYRQALVAAGVGTCVAACSSGQATDNVISCVPVAVPSIVLAVRDSLTGTAAATGASLIARVTLNAHITVDTGQTVDELSIIIGGSPGTFDLTLKKAGYRDWTQNGVVVNANDACHPKTVMLGALLKVLKVD